MRPREAASSLSGGAFSISETQKNMMVLLATVVAEKVTMPVCTSHAANQIMLNRRLKLVIAGRKVSYLTHFFSFF
jgi:hypothetical protein